MDNIKTVLQLEGVNSKGFGMIYQAVMFDTSLPINSKAIYALFCSHLGSGTFLFPKRETILRCLNLSKNAYYKALQPLLDKGYISIRKAKGFINKNVYTICNNPIAVKCRVDIPKADTGILSVDGISAQGYGFIPKIPMVDDRLSVKAKALIALFYSLTAAGSCAFPHRETICVSLGISKNTYYNALKQLIEFNYLEVKQRRQSKGKFTVNDYTLITNPNPEMIHGKTPIDSPCLKNEDNRKDGLNSDFSPCLKNEDNGEDDRVSKIETIPCLKNEDNNNSISNNSIIYSMISTSNHILTTPIQANDSDEMISQKIHTWINFDDIRKLIKEFKLNADPFMKNQVQSMKLILVVGQLLADMLKSDAPEILYHKKLLSRKELVQMVSELEKTDVKEIVQETVYHYEMIKDKYIIRDPRSYLKILLIQHIENYSISSDWWQE